MELKCQIQTYDWGKIGLNSKVALLQKIANPSFEVNDSTAYAELWMGTHSNAPSEIKTSGKLLSSVIAEQPELLGEPIRQVFGDELPYLFKVLSVNKALSIQAHPSKSHAEQLYAEQPDVYKDPNHKPELAIALTPFEALCGFRPIKEIQEFMKDVRELRSVVGVNAAEQFITCNESESKQLLKVCFKNMMTCPPDHVAEQLKHMLSKFTHVDENIRAAQLAPLVERLYMQFPNDIGCFVVYFLNFVSLQPHEALYLGPNEPHAYLSGDCIECMACSDNVVRAGLTPKFKDVETLCAMLSYNCKPASEQLFYPENEDSFSKIFKPPVPDFAVVKIEIPATEQEYCLIPRNCASILLVVQGSGNINFVHLKPGVILFIPAYLKLKIVDVNQDTLMFQAIANIPDLF